MRTLKAYPEYKDSETEWLGEVPSGWKTAKIRRVARIVNGGTPTPAAEYWNGAVLWATPVDLNTVDGRTISTTSRTLTEDGLRAGSAAVRAGSVVLSTRAPIGYSAVAVERTSFNQGCKGLVPSAQLASQFLLFVIQGAKAELIRRGQGTTFLELSTSGLASMPVPIPARDEQIGIANFLDKETAEIDAFIADQEELIGLLAERRAASLLRETLEIKPTVSGSLGRFIRKKERPILGADVVTAFRDGEVTARSNRREEGFTMSEADSGYQGVAVGDIVFHGLDGFAGAVGVSDSDGRCSPVYHVCVSEDGVDPAFMALYLRALGLSGFLHAYAWSVRQRSVDYRNWSVFSKLPVSLPSPPEQRGAVERLQSAFSEIDAAIADAREAIALSRERRAALISAAVTGKIDVRCHGEVA
jgi:type I restriction enzyme S subunit